MGSFKKENWSNERRKEQEEFKKAKEEAATAGTSDEKE